MTIKPEDVGKLSEEEMGEVEQWEAKIDKFLREEFDEERVDTFDLSDGFLDGFLGVYSPMKVNIRRELIRRYEKAGWRVTYGGWRWKGPQILKFSKIPQSK